MSNPWFRFYAEFATDPKIQFMSEALQRRYVFALCVTCNGEIEKVTDEELAYAMRITVEEWQETKKTFIERGLFTPEGRVKNWEKRQYKSDVTDPTNADRQRRYREKKRNGDVTEEKRDVTGEKRPDTDTEKDDYKGEVPYYDIMMSYNKFCPSLRRCDPLNPTPKRQELIRKAFVKYLDHKGGLIQVLDTLFAKAESSDFLTGKVAGSSGRFFKANIDFLFDPEKMPKVIDGDYDNQTPPPRKKEVAF